MSGIGFNSNIDAVNIHFYPRSAPFNLAQASTLFREYPPQGNILEVIEHPISLVDVELDPEISVIGPNYDVWLSEFNIFEPWFDVYGSWLHGLQLSGMMMELIEKEEITKIDMHTLFGRVQWGLVFANDDAFEWNFNHSNTNLQSGSTGCTTIWTNEEGGLSAPGYAMTYFGNAMRYASSAERLGFFDGANEVPFLTATNTVRSLLGWYFNDTGTNSNDYFGDKIVIVNLNEDPVTISRSDILNYGMDRMIQIDANVDPLSTTCTTVRGEQPYPPVVFPRQVANSTIATWDELHVSNPDPVTGAGDIELAPFSFYYFYEFSDEMEGVRLTTFDEEVCNGDNVFVYADISDYVLMNSPTFNWSVASTGSTPTVTAHNDFVRELDVPAGTGASNYLVSLQIDYVHPVNGTVSLPAVSVEITSEDGPTFTNLTINGTNFAPVTGGISIDDLNCAQPVAEIDYTHTGTCQVFYPDKNLVSPNDDPYGSSIVVSPEQTTRYSLVVMDDRGCTASAEITIDPVVSADAGPNMYICDGVQNATEITSAGLVNGFTYYWQYPTTGIPSWTSTDAQPTIDNSMFPIDDVVLKLTVTDPTEECESVDYVRVQFVECCPLTEEDDYELPPSGRISTVLSDTSITQYIRYAEPVYDTILQVYDSLPYLDFSDRHPEPVPGEECWRSGRMLVNGEFIIDEDFSIVNTRVFLGEKAHFVVEPGVQFNITGSQFIPCSERMWSGIWIEHYMSELDIDQNILATAGGPVNCRSSFTGADTAVNATMDAVIGIRNSDFNENYVHVSVSDYVRNIARDINGSVDVITNNSFTCISNNLLLPFSGDRTHVSISLTDVNDISIGTHEDNGSLYEEGNIFSNCDFGVKAIKSSASLFNNEFENISNNDRNNELGHCVYAVSNWLQINGERVHPENHLTIGTGGGLRENDFNDSYIGVYSSLLNLTVNHNNFNSVSRAIKVVESQEINGNIHDNTILNCDIGIDVLGNSQCVFNIEINDITTNTSILDDAFNPQQKIAIRVVDGLPLKFYRNQIDIFNNDIQLYGTHGIWLQSASDVNVIDNEIDLLQGLTTPIGSCNLRLFGILMEESSLVDLCGNNITGSNTSSSIRDTKIGISQISTIDTRIQCNTVDETIYGIEFIDDCEASLIYGNSMGTHTFGWSFGGGNCLGNAQWDLVSQNNLEQLGNPVGNANKFVGSITHDTYKKSNNLSAFQVPYRVSNSNLFPPSNNGWDLNITQQFAAIVPQPQSVSEFDCEEMTTNCSTLIPESGDPERSVEELEEVIENENGNESVEYDSKVSVYNAVERFPGLTDSSMVIDHFYDSAMTTNLSTFRSLYEVMNDPAQRHDSLLVNALGLNSSIYALNNTQANEKELNRIYLEYLRDSDLGSNSNELFSIANQCPFTAGSIVFTARGLYNLINDSIYFDDTELCQSQSSNRVLTEQEQVDEINEIVVYPNPANTHIFVEINKDHKFHTLKLVSNIGIELIVRRIYNIEFLELDVSHLKPGQYSAIFESDVVKSCRKRLSIVR